MKRLTSLIIIVLLLSTILVNAQSTNGIIGSLNAGNTQKLTNYFNDIVEVDILGTEKMCNKMEANQALNIFFKAHRSKSFQLKHEGKAPDGSRFMIGKLQTQAGVFRTYIVLKSKKIHKISFKR